MEFKNFEDMIQSLKSNISVRKMAIAAAHDEHALEAVLMATEEGLIEPIYIGKRVEILKIANDLGKTIKDTSIIDAETDEECAQIAVKMIRDNEASVLMKGKLQTADLLRAVVNKETGISLGRGMSHVALLEVPTYKKLICITDGGMMVYPDLNQKKDILTNAVEVFHNMGYKKPKIAALCAVEVVNPKMQETVDAQELANIESDDFVVAGPISYDLAMSMESAKIKNYESEVTENVDILLMPNMVTGNVVSKALIYNANSTMAGLVVGAKAPIVLTSRGATTREKYLSIVFSAAASK